MPLCLFARTTENGRSARVPPTSPLPRHPARSRASHARPLAASRSSFSSISSSCFCSLSAFCSARLKQDTVVSGNAIKITRESYAATFFLFHAGDCVASVATSKTCFGKNVARFEFRATPCHGYRGRAAFRRRAKETERKKDWSARRMI